MLVPEGKYDVIVKEATLGESRNGKARISIKLVIRNDIDQPCQNEILYHYLWPPKTHREENNQVGGFSYKQIQYLSRIAGLLSGTNYDGLDDWMDDLTNRCLSVTVVHKVFGGKTYANVDQIEKPSHSVCNHKFETDEDAALSFKDEEGTEGLPF